MEWTRFILNDDSTVFQALCKLNDLRTSPLVLFVTDRDDRMIGTLTDGDVRRSLIMGSRLDDKVNMIMNRHFKFIREGDESVVSNLKQFRDLKIKLIPVLDNNDKVAGVINLDRYKSFLPIDVVLMAGGKGERLRPLTETTPKPLLKVGEKSIIDYNIDRLISYGINHISVTVNYLGDQIIQHFREPRQGIQIKCFREPSFLGTIGSIKYVDSFLYDTVLVMNSDLFTNIDYEDFYLHFRDSNADMSVAAIPYRIAIPYGIFELDGEQIKGIIEKPTYNYYANAGAYLIKREVLNVIPEDTFYNATDLIYQLLADGKKVIRYPHNGTWIDIGNPQDYSRANELIKHLD